MDASEPEELIEPLPASPGTEAEEDEGGGDCASEEVERCECVGCFSSEEAERCECWV